jgi:hypothetical protein
MSIAQPVHKRQYAAFISHAHADKTVVDRIDDWLSRIAGASVWYDSRNLPPSATIGTHLPMAIEDSRSLILILSKDSVNSGWVQEEYNAGLGQRTKSKGYRIIPIRIDNCEIPGFLTTTKWIDAPNGQLSLDSACDLLLGLYFDDADYDPHFSRDIYVGRTWQDAESESSLADFVCCELSRSGLRLIGDSKDQAGFRTGDRVKSIIESCGGLAAIFPHRGRGATSKYIIKEADIASDAGLPMLLVAEEGVQLPLSLERQAIRAQGNPTETDDSFVSNLRTLIADLKDEWVQPRSPHYFFFATGLDAERRRLNQIAVRLIERVTGMPCIIGDDIRTGQVQEEITRKIVGAFAVLADISDENLNTCIEAGMARALARPLHLVARGPRRRPPFMFRDQQVWFFEDDIEFLGTIHRIIYPYRRRVINLELH